MEEISLIDLGIDGRTDREITITDTGCQCVWVEFE